MNLKNEIIKSWKACKAIVGVNEKKTELLSS